VPTRLWPLPCRKIHGIGPRTDERLQAMGLRTIGELAACPRETLIERFGASHGAWLHEAAWGRDERPLVTASEPVSLSRETTFERDLHAVHDRAELGRLFTRLCEQVAADLQRKGYVGRTIGIKLRYEDFRLVTRDLTVPTHTADAAVIRRTAGLCLTGVALTRRTRLRGVGGGNGARPAGAPPAAAPRPRIPDLFDAPD
ncbi:MAG: DNA polymerase thumb domain-containing protein, partial [Tepidimonas sp.]